MDQLTQDLADALAGVLDALREQLKAGMNPVAQEVARTVLDGPAAISARRVLQQAENAGLRVRAA